MKLSVSAARDQLAEVVGRVQFGGERITLERRGKPVAVIMSVEDAAFFEELEDRIDLQLAREAKEEMAREGGRTYSHEEVFAELGDPDGDGARD